MKGSETPRSLSKKNLFYLYEGPKDLHEPLNKARQNPPKLRTQTLYKPKLVSVS